MAADWHLYQYVDIKRRVFADLDRFDAHGDYELLD
jgi:hypothetical protein